MGFMPMLAAVIRLPMPVVYVIGPIGIAFFLYDKWDKHFGKDPHV